VLLSLLTLLLIGGTVIYIFEDTYVKTLANEAILQENAYNVQTIVNQYKLDNNTFTESSYNQLKNLMAVYEYQVYIADDGVTLFSNLQHNQLETIEILEPRITYNANSSLYVWEDKTIVTRKITGGTSNYDIIIIHSAEKEGIFKLNRGTFELLMLSFLIVGIGSIFIIMFISRIFTKNLVNQIMIPIKKLVNGAQRIEQGNLDEPVIYQGEDEFEMVCRAFNKMQDSLKSGMEKNAAYEKARTDLVSGISHDLRTPLTSVKGYIKGVKDGVANTPEKQEKYLDIAYKKACEMDVLLQKLFYFSKLETGNMPLYPVKVNLVLFLKEIMKENAEYYIENNLEVSLSVKEGFHYVSIDKEQMSRVIANIIENSIKYRIRDNIILAIEVVQKDDKLVLTLTDNGGGVPQEKLPYLFDQFFRADDARSNKKSGNGLGLYISKYIVEQHGGSISARNSGGLCIEIILPISEE
jgi:signal transduction histidine kinase